LRCPTLADRNEVNRESIISIFVIVVMALAFVSALPLGAVHADAVTGTISIGEPPFDVDVNPSTNMVYVTSYNQATYGTSYLFVVDGSTNEVMATLPPQASDDSFLGVAVNPQTNKIYAANFGNSGVSVFDGASNMLTKFITGVPFPGVLAVNPGSNKVYVLSNNLDLYVIDSATDTVIKNIQHPCGTTKGGAYGIISPNDVAVNALTNTAYVTCVKYARVACNPCYQPLASYAAVVDGSADTVAKNITLGGYNTLASGIKVNPSTNRVYVGGSPSGYVVDGSTNLLIGTIDAGCGCDGRVGVNPSTGMVYFADLTHYKVTIVDGATNAVVGSLAAGNEPRSVGVNPATNRIYVTNSGSQSVSVIDGNAPFPSTSTTSTTTSTTTLTSTTTATTSTSSSTSTITTSTTSSTMSTITTAGIVLSNVQSTSGTVSSSPYQVTLSTFNAGTGANGLLVVGVEANNNVVVSVTFGGVQLTQRVQSFYNNDAEFWYLTNPTGTGDIVVTMSGPTAVVVGAYSLSGVDQTNPIPTTAKHHNTTPNSPKISITTQYQNSWVLDLPSIWGGVTLGSPSGTQHWDLNSPDAVTGASS